MKSRLPNFAVTQAMLVEIIYFALISAVKSGRSESCTRTLTCFQNNIEIYHV